jgi:Uma2 family endonuclease
MTLYVTDAPQLADADPVRHKTWTRSEVRALEETGLFEGMHFELIEGELIDKMGKLRPHVRGVWLAVEALRAIFGAGHMMQEAPIDVAGPDNPRNEPEPDVTVLRRHTLSFDDNPKPEDIVLVLEVADSTIRIDRSTKARLYARARIPEYWLVNIRDRRVIVFRDPEGGEYRTVLEFDERQSISPLEKPSDPVMVTALLP